MKPETQKKLTYLHETKQLIKEALISKGQNVSETDTFRSYVDHILAISGGGTGEVETDIMPEATISGFTLDSTFQAYTPGPVVPATFALTAGETYIVDWDGETYTCEAGSFTYSGENLVYIGNGAYVGQSGNDEPFLISYSPASNAAQLFSNVNTDSHTIRIYQKTSTGGAGSGGSSLSTKWGSVQVADTVATITHGMGVVPDIILITNGLVCDAEYQIIFSLGFSTAMIQALGDNAYGRVMIMFDLSKGTNQSCGVGEGFENITESISLMFGPIRDVTDTTFTVGGGTYGKLKHNGSPLNANEGAYEWIAIAGITG